MSGVIFTFYSYKGGVGRSMALANIGVHFHRHGFRTLLIDMDLEAPGLERYFEGSAEFNNAAAADRPGFCDFIQEYLRRASAPGEAADEFPWPNIDDYITRLGSSGDHHSRALTLMHAGKRSGAEWGKYAQFVQTFDWTDFYERWEGGACLEWFASELRKKADVILIDSRTGVTEMGGVATQHLADAVIVLFGSNLQNVDNSARMALNFASDAVRTERGGRTLDIMAVPSRVDDQDSAGFIEFQKRYQSAFAALPGAVPVDGYSMEHMCIPYLAPFSYREVILFGDKEAEASARRIVEAYTRIAANMQRLAPEGSVLRQGARPERVEKVRVAILAASHEEWLAAGICDSLAHGGIETTLVGSRPVEMDPSAMFRDVFCAVALVTPAFAESALMRSMLQVLTDLGKPVIPAIIQPVDTLPLLLADKAPLDCSSDPERSGPLILEGIERWLQPHTRALTGSACIFINYPPGLSDLASRVAEHLMRLGFSVWWDRMVLPGAEFAREIQHGIDNADLMLVLLSDAVSLSKEEMRQRSYFRSGHGWRPIVVVKSQQKASIPYDLLGYPVVDVDTRSSGFLIALEEAIKHALREGPEQYEGPASGEAPPAALTPDAAERMTKHILNYLDAHNFTKISFERVRKNINPGYSDDLIMALIDRSPERFRRVVLDGERPGIGLVIRPPSARKK